MSGSLLGLGWFKYGFWESSNIVFAQLNSGATITWWWYKFKKQCQSRNQSPYKYLLANLTSKQKLNLKSPIKDISERLTEIKDEFDPFHSIFHPGLQLVNHFSDRIIFYSPKSSNDESLFVYSSKLDVAFNETQKAPVDITVITDGSVKIIGSTTAITYIWKDNKVTNWLKAHATNITPLEAKLIAICIGLMLALENSNTHQIIVITDTFEVGKKIISLGDQYLQKSIIPIVEKIQTFLKKNGQNSIHFWYYPSKLKWPKHILVDEETKSSHNSPILLEKNSFLLSKKEKCDLLLESWQKSFKDSKKKGQLFLKFENNNKWVIKPTYTKEGLWLLHIGLFNSIYAKFTCMILKHIPIEEYWQRFFPNTAIHCLYSEADIEIREHIFIKQYYAQEIYIYQVSWNSSSAI